MKFAFVAKHRTIWLCDPPGVVAVGLPCLAQRSPSARSCSDEELGGKVMASFPNDGTCGARRVTGSPTGGFWPAPD